MEDHRSSSRPPAGPRAAPGTPHRAPRNPRMVSLIPGAHVVGCDHRDRLAFEVRQEMRNIRFQVPFRALLPPPALRVRVTSHPHAHPGCRTESRKRQHEISAILAVSVSPILKALARGRGESFRNNAICWWMAPLMRDGQDHGT